MKSIASLISLIALSLTLLPSLLFYTGSLDLDQVKDLCLVGTIIWFVVTPFWLGRRETEAIDADQVQI